MSTKNKVKEIIEWILNEHPLLNKGFKDKLADKVGYYYSETMKDDVRQYKRIGD